MSEKEGVVEERFGMRDIKLRNIGRKRKAWRLGIVGVQGLVYGMDEEIPDGKHL